MININEKWCIRNEPMFGALYFGVGDQMVCGWLKWFSPIGFVLSIWNLRTLRIRSIVRKKNSPDLQNDLMRFQMLCSAFDSSCSFSIFFPLSTRAGKHKSLYLSRYSEKYVWSSNQRIYLAGSIWYDKQVYSAQSLEMRTRIDGPILLWPKNKNKFNAFITDINRMNFVFVLFYDERT